MTVEAARDALDTLVTETWEALAERSPQIALGASRRVTQYSRGDLAQAEAAAVAARERLERLGQIDQTNLDRTELLTAAYLRHWLSIEMDEPHHWWTGFGIAPYSGSGLGMIPALLFPPIDLTDPAEAARYIKLAGEFAESVEAMRERVLAQK